VEGDELSEIHVVTSSRRSPKQIVRDVQAVLRTDLGLPIDHRIVSVALARADGAPDTPVAGGAESVPEPSSAPRPARAAAPVYAGAADDERDPEVDDRIRFENVNLVVNGQRARAQVELRWKGLPRVGNASGFSPRDDSHRLVAQATTLAVQEFLADPVALEVRDVTIVEMTGRRVAVVVLSLHAHRHEKVLTGSCTVELDTPQAVVLGTLAALNRIVAGMRAKEPTEYVLRAESYVNEY